MIFFQVLPFKTSKKSMKFYCLPTKNDATALGVTLKKDVALFLSVNSKT